MNRRLITAIAGGLVLTASQNGLGQPYPEESYVRSPNNPPSPADRVFSRDQMVHFYDAPGEYGYVVEGKDYGFEALSIITTDTHPGGGPPLHSHETEEAHVLREGRYRVLIGDQRIDVVGPAVVRIPPGMPHTFVNTSDHVIHVVGILPGATISYTELGPNPLVKELEEGGKLRVSDDDNP